MANAFAPDVGVDIGASDVRPYAPDPINYSNLASAVSSMFPEAAKPTEKSVAASYLNPFSQDLARIDQIEDPTKKDVYMRAAYKNALATMPQYQSEIKGIYEQMRGVSLPTGSPLSIQEGIINDFAKTAEGQTAAAVAASHAKRPDGTMDETLFQTAMAESAFKYSQEKATEDRVTRQVTIGDKTAEVAWENELLPAMIAKSNDIFTKVTSAPVMQQVMSGQGTTLDVQTMINGLKSERANLEASFMQTKAKAGVTESEGKYSLKPALVQFDSLITQLETNQTTLQNAASNLSKDDAARFMLNIKDPLIRMAMSDQNAKSQILIKMMDADPNQMAKLNSYIVAPSMTNNAYAAPEGDQGMTNATPVDNLSIEDRAKVLPEFAKDAISLVSQQGGEWKKSQIKAGLFVLNSTAPEKVKTSEHAIGIADTLGYSYLTLIDRPQSSYSSSKDVQDIFGAKAFSIMDAVAKASPTTGEHLYKQAHKYAQDEINKQVDSLTANLATITAPGLNPFEVVLDKGQVVLKLNEMAVKTDPDLKRAMIAASGSVVGGPRGGATTTKMETDPYKVLESYMGLFNLTSGRYGEISDHVKALNILYQQMGKLPESIRNSEFSGQVYLADRISRLPAYGTRVQPEQGAQ